MNAFLIVTLVVCVRSSCGQVPPETYMNVTEVVTYYGYPIEAHKVVTDDGYILTIHRIPFGKNSPAASNKPVALLQHGLLDSSFTWVANLPSQSLGYILADRGYDVWLGNVRGNVYGRAHQTLSPSTNAFWDFTWDDMATIDLPNMIDYVIGVTKVPKLSYIGHSQGTGIGFAKFSENSALNSNICSFTALCPAAYIGHLKGALLALVTVPSVVNLASQLLTRGEFLPSNELVTQIAAIVCGNMVTSPVCSNILFLMAGYSTGNLNETRIPVYLGHLPAGTSSKNIDHYVQGYQANKFQKYSYGMIGNMVKYNTLAPPLYELNTYGVPVGIFFGGNDWLTTPIDVNRTIVELGGSVAYVSYVPNYNHLDFVWGVNAANEVYNDVINFIRIYQ